MTEIVCCFASCLYLLPEKPTVQRKGTTKLGKSQRERVATTVAKKKGTDPSHLTPQNDRPIDPPASAVARPHRHQRAARGRTHLRAPRTPPAASRIASRCGGRFRPWTPLPESNLPSSPFRPSPPSSRPVNDASLRTLPPLVSRGISAAPLLTSRRRRFPSSGQVGSPPQCLPPLSLPPPPSLHPPWSGIRRCTFFLSSESVTRLFFGSLVLVLLVGK